MAFREEDSEADFLHVTQAVHSLESAVLGVALPAEQGACPTYTLERYVAGTVLGPGWH